MKKLLFMVIVLFLLSACSSNQEEVASNKITKLSEYSLNDIKQKESTYSYNYAREITKKGFVDKTLEYTKNEEKYEGKLTLTFSSTEESYVEVIPKSFASHIDNIEFSVEPSNIINPDPEVEFTNIKGKVEIKSKETIQEDIEATMQEQVIKGELEICSKLEHYEYYACTLRVISKYRNHKSLKEELSQADLTNFDGAVMVAVLKEDVRNCKKLNNPEDKEKCFEFSYQILVEECNIFSDAIYRECVRHHMYLLPDAGMRKVFCDHIDDAKMHDECTGKAAFSSCDEIKNKFDKEACQLNIATTKRSIHLCSQIQTKHDACYAAVAVVKKNAKDCDLVNDSYFKGMCKTRIALINEDKGACYAIEDSEAKDRCLSVFLTNVDSASEKMCDAMDEDVFKNSCLSFLAAKKNNPKICESFVGEFDDMDKALCYLGIGVKHLDEKACSKVVVKGEDMDVEQVENMQDVCHFEIAVNKSKIKLCDKIHNDDMRELCINSFSEEKPEDIPLPSWMNCPVPKGAELDKWTQYDKMSGYSYHLPKYPNRQVGPNLKYFGDDFKDPNQFYCYDSEGKKTGPFKTYFPDTGAVRTEGAYDEGKYNGEIKKYSAKDVLRSLETYNKGVLNGPSEAYDYYEDSPSFGQPFHKGAYKDGKRDGTWYFYKDGELHYTQEYNMGTAGESVYV